MQKLQLYIDTTPSNATPTYQRVDLFKDESVSITQTIQNIKDIKKIFTDFTQTFALPTSQTNNKIFQHYNNFNITPGFDARNKRRAKIELNFIPFKTGFIKLNSVQLKKNSPYSYKTTFFGETINLKDLLGDDDLGALDFTAYNLDYNATNIRSNLIGNLDAIITPLITHTTQLYYDTSKTGTDGNLYYSSGVYQGVLWSELKYAIRLDEIITAIETKYGITFSTDFFNNSTDTWNNLYMWLHRKKGDVKPAVQVSKEFGSFTLWSLQSGTPQLSTLGASLIVAGDLVTYPNNIIGHTLTFTPTSNTPLYDIRIFRNGSLIYQKIDCQGVTPIGDSNFTLSAGTYTLDVGTADANGITFNTSNIVWEINGYIGGESLVGAWTDIWRNGNSLSTSADFEFKIVEQIPKIKVIDFLTGLFQMFNLTAYIENDIIVVKKLDDYYSSSSVTWDIDEYVDINSSSVDLALPYKEVKFRYAGLGSFLATQFEQLENTGWGTIDFSLDEAKYTAPSKSYIINIPYEHMQYQRLVNVATGSDTTIQWGWSVNENQESYIGKPLIFYAIKQTGGTAISFLNTPSSHTSQTAYIIPSNSKVIVAGGSTDNLNFQAEINEYTGGSTFTGTLFKNYYETYIQNIYNNKRRLTKINAHLPLKMLYNLKLNDKISLNNNTYRINSLKTNLTTGKSNFELLNIV